MINRMSRRTGLLLALALVLALPGCGGSSKHASPTLPRPSATSAAPAPVAYPRITRASFGMHWLDHTSPAAARMSFGSVRLMAGDAVTWPMLQPTPSTRLDTKNPAVHQLDSMVAGYARRGVQPLIVLGPTPAWAAEQCPNGTWPVETCAPSARGMSSPWARYVQFLAHRYRAASFEMWNEPNLRNGYNDTVEHLAEMQATAYSVLKHANPRAVLVSPTVAVTAGDPLGWLTKFFAAPGGRDFDVFGVHLYSEDAAARAGNGPEWSLDMVHQVNAVLTGAGLQQRAMWDTEVNVGRYQFRNSTSRVFTGLDGAAMVARTYALQLGSGVRRVYWYAGDDRVWSGTWMVNTDGVSLTPAGQAFNVAFHQLVGAVPHGCSSTPAGLWSCRFGLSGGRGSVQMMWTTSGPTRCTFVAAGARRLDVLGHPLGSASAAPFDVTSVPTYVVGNFPVDAACR